MRKGILIFSAIILLFTTGLNSSSITNVQPKDPLLIEDPQEFEVEFFPVAPYNIGDLISVRVTYTGTDEIPDEEITVSHLDQPQSVLGSEKFNRYDQQADFYWILDTSTFQPGFIRLLFEIPEMNLSWEEGINLLPSEKAKDNNWVTVNTDCCVVHYIENTDAAQDISQIQEILEETAEKALAQFYPSGIPEVNPLKGEIQLVLVPAILGHGGFATDTAVVTYTDRNWVGSSFETIVHHEIVHVLDRKLNDEGPRPSLLAEGIAVYLSGGHYRDGDPLLRVSALIKMGKYIPLETLANDFYSFQHEIAYMEGAALVAYLVELWGWEGFLDFYFNLEQKRNPSATISAALENESGMDLDRLEDEFMTYLNTLEPGERVISDVRLTIEVYDMIRRYQTAVIPSAHYKTAWWPPIDRMIEMEITGDYGQREKSPLNILVENRFIRMQGAFAAEDYQRVQNELDKIDHYLNIIENSGNTPSHYDLGWPLPHQPLIPTTP